MHTDVVKSDGDVIKGMMVVEVSVHNTNNDIMMNRLEKLSQRKSVDLNQTILKMVEMRV